MSEPRDSADRGPQAAFEAQGYIVVFCRQPLAIGHATLANLPSGEATVEVMVMITAETTFREWKRQNERYGSGDDHPVTGDGDWYFYRAVAK